jgi:hypothetical protein
MSHGDWTCSEPSILWTKRRCGAGPDQLLMDREQRVRWNDRPGGKRYPADG